jgi:hypothetical protein
LWDEERHRGAAVRLNRGAARHLPTVAQKASFMPISNCRSCGGDDLRVILDLGSQLIANALLSEQELDHPEARFRLAVAFCRACALLQVTETVPPEVLYQRDYLHFSSSSPALLKHLTSH